MKVLVTTSSFGKHDNPSSQALAEAGITFIVNPLGRRLTEDDAAALLAEHDPVGVVAGVEPLTTRVLSAAPSLRCLARCGTGMENVDLGAARARGLRVSNTPDAPAVAVSELTLGLMLACLRRIAEADRTLRAGTWKPLMGGLLGRRTVGIIGYGRIGRRVALLVEAFGARIIVHDPFANDTGDVEFVTLERLAAEADIVSLHAAGSSLLVDKTFIGRMKTGAILINTARGPLVDEAALLAALESGHLAGAGLDVFGDEPYTGPLAGHASAVLTAHMGSYASESRAMQEAEALDNLVADLRAEGILT